MVRQAWNIAKQSNPPGRSVLPLDPTQEARGGERIEETSHSPWIAIAVFFTIEEVRGDTMQEEGKGQLHQSRGSRL